MAKKTTPSKTSRKKRGGFVHSVGVGSKKASELAAKTRKNPRLRGDASLMKDASRSLKSAFFQGKDKKIRRR